MKHLATLFLLLTGLTASVQFTIAVHTIPANTPANDPIHIAGDFQNWDPSSQAHILSYQASQDFYYIDMPANTGSISFKFTRGNWTTVESNETGQFIPDRTYTPINSDTLWLSILGWEDLGGNGSTASTAASNVSILSNGFHMTELNRDRKVWIYLPPDYDTSNEDYPVLYMHDGQNVFDLVTSFAGEWEVDETLNALHAAGDPGIIVVAIDNGGSLRIEEYTPWFNTQYGGGDGDAYINFIVDDLKPFVDANYRTLPGREHTGIMGSSLGGLISTYGAVEHQDVFSKVGAFSPAYWINPEAYQHVSATGQQESMRIYQLGGSLEGPSIVDEMHNMHDILAATGFGADTVLTVEVANGEHSEWFWAQEFEAAYLWLFRTGNDSDTSTSATSLPRTGFSASLYPNPARDAITIEAELETAATVQIQLRDVSGRQIAELYRGSMGRGANRLQLNIAGMELAASSYLVTINAGRQQQTLPQLIAE